MSRLSAGIWMHIFFHTKNNLPLIDEQIAQKLFAFMRTYIETSFHCTVKIVNGTPDHVHILFLLNGTCRYDRLVQNLKEESSRWMDQQTGCCGQFRWQRRFGMCAVHVNDLPQVTTDIQEQSRVHTRITFEEEYKLLISGSHAALLPDHDELSLAMYR